MWSPSAQGDSLFYLTNFPKSNLQPCRTRKCRKLKSIIWHISFKKNDFTHNLLTAFDLVKWRNVYLCYYLSTFVTTSTKDGFFFLHVSFKQSLKGLKAFKVLHLRAKLLHHKKKKMWKRKRRKSAFKAQKRWKTKLSSPQATEICSLWINAKIKTYQCWDVPQLYCWSGYKNNHQLITVMPVQYVEHSQAEKLGIPHHVLLNGPQLSRSNENNFITGRSQELSCQIFVLPSNNFP